VAPYQKLSDNQSMPYSNFSSCFCILVVLLLKSAVGLCIPLFHCCTPSVIIIIIIIIIVIIIPVITITHAVYNNIPQTNRFNGTQCCSCSVFTICATCNVICTVHSAAAVLCLQFAPHVMLFVRYTVLQLFCIYNLRHM